MMKRTILVLALVAAACTSGGGDGEDPVSEDGKRIAILGIDGNISTFDPANRETTRITNDAGPAKRYAQPTWSADGTRLAYVVSSAATTGPGLQAAASGALVGLEAQTRAASAINIVPAKGGNTTVIETPFPAFYLYWSPDGNRLAFLGNDSSIPALALGMIATTPGTLELIDTGQPYYFAWSPRSDRLLVHAGDSELFFLDVNGGKQSVGPDPGAFSAPNWLGDTLVFPVSEDDRQILRVTNEDGTVRRDVADFGTAMAVALNPDEERLAYIDIADDATALGLGPLVVEGPEGVTEVAERAGAFFWNGDGSRLLYLTPEVAADDFSLRWNVWDGTESIAFETFLPTATFVQQYLPFFGQYGNSLSFFSPDGQSFTFAGTIEGRGEGIWLQGIERDSAAELISSGEFSTWAP